MFYNDICENRSVFGLCSSGYFFYLMCSKLVEGKLHLTAVTGNTHSDAIVLVESKESASVEGTTEFGVDEKSSFVFALRVGIVVDRI